MPIDLGTARAIAREFAGYIQERCKILGAENPNLQPMLPEINTENARRGEDGSCATHDYFDSNLDMALAFERIMRRNTVAESEADAELWSTAWDIARRAQFDPEKI